MMRHSESAARRAVAASIARLLPSCHGQGMLVCPACHARYRLQTEAQLRHVAGGRPVRCRVCGAVWRPAPEDAAGATGAAPGAGRAAPGPRRPRSRRHGGRGGLPWLGAAAGVAALAALGLAAAHPPALPPAVPGLGPAAEAAGRVGAIVRRVAASAAPAVSALRARLAVSLGGLRPALPQPPQAALRLAEVTAAAGPLPGARAGPAARLWDVRAVLLNPGDAPARVPPLDILLLDGKGRTLAVRRLPPPARRVAPGGRLELAAGAVDPRGEAGAVLVRLRPPAPGRP